MPGELLGCARDDAMNARTVELSRPLPEEISAARGPLMAYRKYPVFSVAWLWRRTLSFAAISGGVGALLGLALWGSRGEAGRALAMVGYFTVGITALGAIGPALATVVRHRRWRRERLLVVMALLVGVGGASLVDGWASAGIERTLDEPKDKAGAGGGGVLGDGLALAAYALIGGGLALARYFTEERELAELAHRRELAVVEERRRELDAKLSLLQAQVEPHFLFNTLASVRSLIGEDPAEAHQLVDALVSYLRATIPRLREPGHLDSTLGQQLDICTAYLQVMQIRMGRLTVRVEVAEGLREVAFPPLLLMTLVENAIKHGIERKRGAGQVVLRAHVEAAADGDALVVAVIDDGLGLCEGLGSGVGLKNVRETLAARYGGRASFVLAGGAAGGAEATVRLPLERAS